MGGGKGPDTPGPGPAETTQANISKQMYDTTDPLRNLWIQEFMRQWGYSPASPYSTTAPSTPSPATSPGGKPIDPRPASELYDEGGNYIPWSPPATASSGVQTVNPGGYVFTGRAYDPKLSILYQPLYNAARESTNQGYQQARDAILANTPKGGGQVGALAQLETAAAKERANVPFLISQQVMNDLMQKGYGTAFGAPQQALAGLTGATAAEIQRNNAALQAQTATNAGKKQTGTAIGLMAATGGLGGLGAGAAAAGGGASLAGFAPSTGWAAPTAFFS